MRGDSGQWSGAEKVCGLCVKPDHFPAARRRIKIRNVIGCDIFISARHFDGACATDDRIEPIRD